MKNNYKVTILIISIFIITLISGCLEEKDVTGPIPYKSDTRTSIDTNKPETFNGNYRPLDYTVNPEKTNVLDIYTLQGAMNLWYNDNTTQLTYNYGLKYAGYDTSGDYAKQIPLIDIPEYSVDNDSITIKFNEPFITTYNNETYTINSIQKIDDNLKSISDNATIDDINTQYTLCDPREEGINNPKSCTSVDGAVKYIGYYRIESIYCGDTIYRGGEDFAGEMVTNPSLESDLDVVIPIIVKVQIANNSKLKQCFLESSNNYTNNLYYFKEDYKLTSDDYAQDDGSIGLESAFTKVGLIGLSEEDDEKIRTSQIEYRPKDHTNYNDMTYGDNNNTVRMRLKIIEQGILNDPPAKDVDNTPYTTNP